MPRVAIIGGGAAGSACALSLRERGVRSMIFEREGELGGLAGRLGCKGVDRCVRCDACLAKDKASEAGSDDAIERVKGAEVLSLTGGEGDFRLTVRGEGGETRAYRAAAVVCAIGAEPSDAARETRLGYGDSPDIITSLELDQQLAELGAVKVPSTGLAPRSVGFVQCVGSRDPRSGATYCSKACCKYSFKLAQALKAIDPSCAVTFYFMDWRLYDPRENVRAWASGTEGVRLVRSRPSDIGSEGRPSVRFASEGDVTVAEERHDLVVLTLGMRPAEGSAALAKALGIEVDGRGFMRTEDGKPCRSSRAGVFLAGACAGPKDILESVMEAGEAANLAAAVVEGRHGRE